MTKTLQFSIPLALASVLLAHGVVHADTTSPSAGTSAPTPPAPIVRSHGHTVLTPVPAPDQNNPTPPAKPASSK